MNQDRRRALLSLLGLLFTAACSSGGDGPGDAPSAPVPPAPAPGGAPVPTSAATAITAMGTGFNLGNTFDVASHSTRPADIFPLIDLYVSAGMRHIRIPVTWSEGFNGDVLADATGALHADHPRLTQLEAVVDYALSKNLYVVVNTHHETWLYKTYDDTPAQDAVFTRLWGGIAARFAGRSSRLVFEVLNEPQGVFGDWSGGASPGSPRALELTRRINQVGYEAIRATGGANATRVVMVGTNGMGNHLQLSAVYPTSAALPGSGSDTFLAAQVHTYDPWSFCGQDGNNSAWPGAQAIAAPVRTVAAHARTLGVPVNYGEFGVGRDANASERDSDIVREYYRTLKVTALAEGLAPTAWDDRGWFGLVTANGSGGFAFTNRIVPTMLEA
jgi:aryl-phospho-beta-D-glucosidase BglC (GH1 family)